MVKVCALQDGMDQEVKGVPRVETHVPLQVYQRWEPRQTRLRVCLPILHCKDRYRISPACRMSVVIGSSYPLRFVDLMQERRLKEWVSSMSSLLLVSTVIVFARCEMRCRRRSRSNPELAWKMIFSDPCHQPARDTGAGGLFFNVYLEANPKLDRRFNPALYISSLLPACCSGCLGVFL